MKYSIFLSLTDFWGNTQKQEVWLTVLPRVGETVEYEFKRYKVIEIIHSYSKGGYPEEILIKCSIL